MARANPFTLGLWLALGALLPGAPARLPAAQADAGDSAPATLQSAWETGLPARRGDWSDPATSGVEALGAPPRPPSAGVPRDLLAWDPQKAIILNLDEQRIQLRSTPVSYLQLDVAVEFSEAAVKNELEIYKSIFEEEIDQAVRMMRPDAMRTLEGKLKLKRHILRTLNSSITKGVARDVYFVKFVILDAN